MTEFWVSKAMHFCEYCHIYLADNKATVGLHENGNRHREAVRRRLADMRRKTLDEKKEQAEALRDMERIERQAKKQYEKDLEELRKAGLEDGSAQQVEPSSPEQELDEAAGDPNEWVEDGSGYFYNAATKWHFDSNSGLYYNPVLGRWATQEEAAAAAEEGVEVPVEQLEQAIATLPPTANGGTMAPPSNGGGSVKEGQGVKQKGGGAKEEGGAPKPKQVGRGSSNLSGGGGVKKRKVVGVPSSLAVARQKREGSSKTSMTEDEKKAQAAREAARARIQQRTLQNRGFV